MRHSRHATRAWFPLALLLLAVPLAAYAPDAEPRVPEHVEVRLRNRRVVHAPVYELLSVAPQTFDQRSASQRVRMRTETQNGFVYLLFLNETAGRFPVFGAGSMVIRRSLDDGSFSQVKVFLRDDERFFVRIRPIPDENRVSMSVYAMDVPVHEGVILPFSIQSILESPFRAVIEATSGIVRWESLLAPASAADYGAVRVMAERTRLALPTLPDAEDGAMDEDGNLVFIETLRMQNNLPGFNCSGFAKWVCDGLFHPLTGRYMRIAELKVKHHAARGHRFSRPAEDARDPYFGLDWSRNIALTIAAAQGEAIGSRGEAMIDIEARDVRSVDAARYIEDVGYKTTDIGLVLFRLALSEPGHFYIGSVNTEFGSEPVLRQHIHIVVFFPYFDEAGRFHVDVMERNVETGLDSLYRRYPLDFIHLVRVRADASFEPPQIGMLQD